MPGNHLRFERWSHSQIVFKRVPMVADEVDPSLRDDAHETLTLMSISVELQQLSQYRKGWQLWERLLTFQHRATKLILKTCFRKHRNEIS